MDYIKYIRSKVGHEKIILATSGAIVLNDKNQVLLQLRSDNCKWAIPGGCLDLDETVAECAIRELKEETNLDIEITKLLGVYDNFNASWPNGDLAHTVDVIYLAKMKSFDLKFDEESLDLRFFDIDEAYNLVWDIHKKPLLDLKELLKE
jgi:ADP-ribose pyrophosphatase YjhB (NUDIX family)